MFRFSRYRTRLVSSFLVGSMLLAWSGAMPGLLMAAAKIQDPALTPRARQAVELLDRLCTVAQARLAKPGADPADPAARSAQLNGDLPAIFTFVAGQIAFEPYRGQLRGAGGTLAAGAGNAVDRAALLAAMLKAGGHEVRLVQGTLPADKAGAIVQQFLGRDPLKGVLASYAAGNVDLNAIRAFAQESGLQADQLQKWIEKQDRDAQGFSQQTGEATEAHFAYLKSLLQQNKVTLGRSAEAWQKELVDRVTAHAWVQVKQGEQWVDLDPTLPGAKVGEKLTDGQPIEKPDPAQRHQLQFKLVYRSTADGQAKEEALIDQVIFADEALTDAPQFRIVPADPMPNMDQALEKPQQALDTLAKIKKFQPVLRLGKKVHAGRVFDTEGNLYDVSADGRVQGAAGMGSAMGGMFGGGLTGGGDAKPKTTFGQLAVVLTSSGPGGKPRVQERILLTNEDVTGKHVVLPIVGWEILVQTHLISPQQAEYGSLKHNLAVWGPAVQVLKDNQIEAADIGKLANLDPAPYPEFLVNFATMRQAMMAELLKQAPGVVPLIDTPQVVVLEQRFCLHVGTVNMCNKASIDIVDNAVSFIPTKDGVAAADVAMRLGVYDTVTEAALMQEVTKAPVGTALTAAERGRIKNLGAAVVAPGAIDPIAALPDAEKGWIKKFEPASRRILVVDAATPLAAGDMPAWWTLDPETGTILGRGPGGRGAALTENAVTCINYGICLIAVMYDVGRNVQKNGGYLTGRQGAKSIGSLVGCFAGFAAGIYQVGRGVQVAQNLFSFAIAVFGTEMDVGG